MLSVFSLYPWVLVGGLIYILIHIARFYEKKYAELYRDAPRQRTYYALFLIPIVLFLFAAGRYALCRDLAGDLAGDLAFMVGGIVLAASSYYLYRLMTGGRH